MLVNDHDFPSDAKGVALPYGIYDLSANHGYLFVGTTHDTADFAVDNVVRWWNYHGKRHYPEKRQLLILADGTQQRRAYPPLEARPAELTV
ncbi:MAG: ISAzo13-like element transposase-related protein [Acidimicrobiales bacterium]